MDLVFINVKKPRDALQLAKERGVRSHVTRYQWKQLGPRKKTLLASPEVNGDERHVDPESHPCSTLECASILPQIGGLRIDSFHSYPISCQPWTPLLVDHCKLFEA